jgi:hypothetical protein
VSLVSLWFTPRTTEILQTSDFACGSLRRMLRIAPDDTRPSRSQRGAASFIMQPTKLRVLALAAGLFAGGCTTPERATPGAPSLKGAACGRFEMGVGLSDRIAERPGDWALLTNQFSTITPENSLKPDPVQAAEGQFRFTQPDAFVNFATAHGLKVVGHCLVWAKDDRAPAWFYRDGTNVAGRALLLARMGAGESSPALRSGRSAQAGVWRGVGSAVAMNGAGRREDESGARRPRQ